jgi:hypothetical protein
MPQALKDLFVQLLKHSEAIQYVIGGAISTVAFLMVVRYDNRKTRGRDRRRS